MPKRPKDPQIVNLESELKKAIQEYNWANPTADQAQKLARIRELRRTIAQTYLVQHQNNRERLRNYYIAMEVILRQKSNVKSHANFFIVHMTEEKGRQGERVGERTGVQEGLRRVLGSKENTESVASKKSSRKHTSQREEGKNACWQIEKVGGGVGSRLGHTGDSQKEEGPQQAQGVQAADGARTCLQNFRNAVSKSRPFPKRKGRSNFEEAEGDQRGSRVNDG